MKGWLIRPAIATPLWAKPISVPQTGAPEMKARVPSTGSMIHVYSLVPELPHSSPMTA